ncbi:bacteriocin-like protein [Chryseobacterium sp. RU37D]
MKNLKRLSRHELKTLKGGFRCEGISFDRYCNLPA